MKLASLLPDPEARACVEALYEANPDGTAELLLAFPDAKFSWCKGEREGETPARVEGARTAGTEGSSTTVGRLF